MLYKRKAFFDKAERTIACHSEPMVQPPRAYMNLILAACDYLLRPPREIALIGPADSPVIQQILGEINGHFLPGHEAVWCDPASPDAETLRARIPLLQQRGLIGGQPAAYVCYDGVCLPPVIESDELARQLEECGKMTG
ncbi:MAG: hypothetical protein NTX50_28135 [Candidatus Sumerlaeota bacterium]|nr:hypothetical protein [Candidatus Sumerlaeota bacterium]